MAYFAALTWLALALVALQPPAPPVEVAPAPRAASAKPADDGALAPRARHALIICGHPGDAEHTKTFTETVRKLGDGLAKTAGIPPERQRVLFGAEPPKDLKGATGPATKEAVAAAVA